MHRCDPTRHLAQNACTVQNAPHSCRELAKNLRLVWIWRCRPGETVDAIRAVLPGFNVWRSLDWWPTPQEEEEQQQPGREEGKAEL